MIEITSVKIVSISIEPEGSETKIKGTYELISSKGKTIAKQSFNGYDTMKIDFEKSLAKNFLSDIEQAVELELGIQDAVKNLKKGKE